MSGTPSPNRNRTLRSLLALTSFLTLAACADMQMPAFLDKQSDGEDVVARASSSATTTERDVEAPDIFQATEAGLWDGRPSLGGVWVAHPDVKDPGRAIIRNEANGQFVIGALFRKERQTPGPRLQVSSDAAAALGVLAGQPTNLNVVALRREEVTIEEPAAELAAIPAAAEISEQPLDPVVDGAAKALEVAALSPEAAAPAQVAAPAEKPRASALSKPFVQIGIFSVEENARNTATAMRTAGMVPTVKEHNSKGKTFWRVVVGPAQTKSELSTLMKTIKSSGFTDAYAVTN